MSSKHIVQWILAALAALALAACHQPQPVYPALWLVEGAGGQKAWLFGTIHALPEAVDWRSGKVEAALAVSDRLVLEVANPGDDAAAQVFVRLAKSPGLPPLRERLTPAIRPTFDQVMAAHGLTQGALDTYETWAAALALQQAIARDADIDSDNGIDRALATGYPKQIEELEGAASQLAIFDRMAEAQQRELLYAVLRDANAPQGDDRLIEQSWAKGDLAPIAAETERGFLRDPSLRAALLTNRNKAWAERLAASLRQGAHPFVAVGAAHLAGPDGLPALLIARGYKVTRIQ